MTLSFLGWINGLTALAIISFSIILGLHLIYKAKQAKAKLLFIMGLMIIFSGMGWIGSASDFFVVLITGNNINRSFEIIFVLGFMFIPPMALLASMLIAEIVIKNANFKLKISKWHIISVFIILGIIYGLFLFLDTKNSIQIIYPEVSGENLVSSSINFISVLGIIMAFYGTMGLVFGGIGFFYKSRKLTGVLKKKYLYLSLGFIFYMICAPLDSIIGMIPSIYILILLIRTGVILSFWFWYLGLKESAIKKPEYKKEMKVEGHLFRLYEKKQVEISPEDVTYYKEQEICLVCKSKVGGFCYICSDCRALYCKKCVQALLNLENACWVCHKAFDPSKPSKPFEKEDLDNSKQSEKEKNKNITKVSKKGYKKKLKKKKKKTSQRVIKKINASQSFNINLEKIYRNSNLTIISNKSKKIKRLDLEETDFDDFVHEILIFSPNERYNILDIMLKLNYEDKGKIKVKRAFKDNIKHQRSIDDIVRLSLLGSFMLFFLFGVVTTIGAVLIPLLTSILSLLLLIFFGTSAFFFVLYKIKTLEITREEIVLNAIQDYLDENKTFSIESIIPYLTSRFSKSSVNISTTGVQEILQKLVKKKMILEGSKLTKHELLINSKRRAIYDYVKKNPGVYVSKIAKQLNFSNYITYWHLQLLFRFGCIHSMPINGHEIYFHPEFNPKEVKRTFFISKEKSTKIIDFLRKNDQGLSKTNLIKEFNMHHRTITNYLKNLEEVKVIIKKKMSKKTLYFLNE